MGYKFSIQLHKECSSISIYWMHVFAEVGVGGWPKEIPSISPSQIKKPLFLFWTSQFRSLVSFSGHNQCTKSHDSEQVLFFTIDYVKLEYTLKKIV